MLKSTAQKIESMCLNCDFCKNADLKTEIDMWDLKSGEHLKFLSL